MIVELDQRVFEKSEVTRRCEKVIERISTDEICQKESGKMGLSM